MISVFSSPNPLLFGTGTSKLLGEKLKQFGCKKVLVVYDQGIKNSGIADKILKIIHDSGIETVIYDAVQADPPDYSADEAGILGLKEKIDGVVGVGGGSALDTAKAAKMLQTNPPPINQYFGRDGVITKPSVPLVVIPTTAGTGSESTPGGVITDTKKNIKLNIAGIGCAVNLGIVDPELTISLPPFITASTRMDALCHAVESYTSNLANRYCEVIAKEAFTLIGKYLVRAFENGSDLEAREGMMFAASLGGISMSGPLCHLAHDTGKLLAVKYHIAHGNGNAIFLPQVLDVIAPAVPEKVKDVAIALGGEVPPDATPAEIGKIACETVQNLIRKLKLPMLRELGPKLGFTKEDLLSYIPEGVVATQQVLVNLYGEGTSPIPVTKEIIETIISRSYDEN